MQALSVIVPSLPQRYAMLSQAVDSIRAQKADAQVQIIVALEAGAEHPAAVTPYVDYIDALNQSAKINAGVMAARHPLIAILHDDDLWHREFLAHALNEIATADFVSSTALQTDDDDEIIAISDCPVPSGWLFTRELFERVGPWSQAERFHPDSEWLGRLGETSGVQRAHLIEQLSPAPRIRIGGEWRYNQLAGRPGLQAFLQQARPPPRIVRHKLPMPLVIHRQHGDGIMQRIAEPERWMQSQWEYQRMTERFGRIPW